MEDPVSVALFDELSSKIVSSTKFSVNFEQLKQRKEPYHKMKINFSYRGSLVNPLSHVFTTPRRYIEDRTVISTQLFLFGIIINSFQ